LSDETEITSLDALALAAAVKSRQFSCVQVMDAFLDRIELLNPRVNAIVSLQPRELLRKRRDAQLARGEPCGPLHGFPAAIKDLDQPMVSAPRSGRRCLAISFRARIQSSWNGLRARVRS